MIHLRSREPLRGAIAGTAELQRGSFAGSAQRLGDTEIEQAHGIVGSQVDIGWFDITVDHRRLPGVELGQLLADFQSDDGGAVGIHHVLALQHLGQIASLHVLHGDEEEAILLAKVVDFNHARIERLHLALNGRAAPLGFDHHLGNRVVAGADELERGPPVLHRIDGQVDIGHAVADPPHDFVASDFLRGCHVYPPARNTIQTSMPISRP